MIKKIMLLALIACNVFSAALPDDKTFFQRNRLVTPPKEDGTSTYSFECIMVTSPNTLKKVTVSTDYGTDEPFRRIVTITDRNDTFGNISDNLAKRLFRYIYQDTQDDINLPFLFFAVEDVKLESPTYLQLKGLGFRPYSYNENPMEYSMKFLDEVPPGSEFVKLGVHRKDERIAI